MRPLFGTAAGWRSALLLVGWTALLALPGCSGCGADDPTAQAPPGMGAAADGGGKSTDKGAGKTDDASKDKKGGDPKKAGDDKSKDDKNKEKPKPLPDFEHPRLSVMPGDGVTPSRAIKPGHWMSAVLEMKANNYDFPGELEAYLTSQSGARLALDRVPYRLASSRPAILPKGQKKYFELTFFTPLTEDAKSPKLWTSMSRRGGGEIASAPADALMLMPPHQYYFVVLARDPLGYTFLKTLDSIRPPSEFIGSGTDAHYLVYAPKIDHPPLPSHLLTWTSIAYVLWDDVNPNLLPLETQKALIDWLHWGGQLLISGPDSLPPLQEPGGFLTDYLPATSGATVKLTEESLATLNEKWSLGSSRLSAVTPWVGVQLTPHADAAPLLNTGGLAYERRVGQGRIVTTAFRLHQRELRNWRSFDSFFNACLLRRPARKFIDNEQGGLETQWVKLAAPSPSGFNDPLLTTHVRILGRDANTNGMGPDAPLRTSRAPSGPRNPGQWGPTYGSDPSAFEEPSPGPGLGGWSDFNIISNSARSALRSAAGIEIPKSSFVVWSLAVYLLVIGPVNWAVFRLIRRVEWAWIAAPLLAIVGAVAVTKMARLDIGFSRSQSDMALVEMHAGYPRAHVTRYTALYTSLSSNYEFEFDDPGAQALPFAADASFRLLIGQGVSPLSYRRDDMTRLQGVEISSNSTSLVHSEQVADLGRGISLNKLPGGGWRITNGTPLKLQGARVVRATADAGCEVAVLDDLDPGQSKTVQLENCKDGWKDSRLAVVVQGLSADPESTWNQGGCLREWVTLLENSKLFGGGPWHTGSGDARLFAWTSDELPGMRVSPAAPQVHRAALIVAHLDYADLPAPQKDDNLRPTNAADALP